MKIKFIILAIALSILITSCTCNCGSEIENLQVRFVYGNGNELNTFENYYIRILDNDIIKIPFTLNVDEKQRIAELAAGIRFFSMPDTLESTSKISGEIQELRIKVGVLDKTVVWYNSFTKSQDERMIAEIAGGIKEIIESKKDFMEISEETNTVR